MGCDSLESIGERLEALDKRLQSISKGQEFSVIILQSTEGMSLVYLRRKLAGISTFLILTAVGEIAGEPLGNSFALGLAGWFVVALIGRWLGTKINKNFDQMVDGAADALGFGDKFTKRAEDEALRWLWRGPNVNPRTQTQYDGTSLDVRRREAVIKACTKNIPLAEDVDISALARNTPGYGTEELASMVDMATRIAAKYGRECITMADLCTARSVSGKC